VIPLAPLPPATPIPEFEIEPDDFPEVKQDAEAEARGAGDVQQGLLAEVRELRVSHPVHNDLMSRNR